MLFIVVLVVQLAGLAWTLHNIGWEFRVNVFAMLGMWIAAASIDLTDYLIVMHFFK